MFDHLVKAGLVKQKRYENGLSVFKYTRKVFYDALWNTDPLLLEARGMVLDDEGNKVMWPFTKVFNHNENNTVCDAERLVDVVYKVNGFLGVVGEYKGETIYGTTGTLDSDYAKMVEKHVSDYIPANLLKGFTWMFEICDVSDPHIVHEQEGAWLIGVRRNSDGAMATEYQLDDFALAGGFMRPEWTQMTFGEATQLAATSKNEGFMIRDAWTGEFLMKIKTPHYLTKKFIMRMGAKKVDFMFDNKVELFKTIDEEFYGIVNYITSSWTAENWKLVSEVERRAVIEKYFEMGAE